jgi:O-acetylserine/cysteine efflux transporter
MKTRDILLVTLVAITWGFNFIAVKWAVADLPPFLGNAGRFAIVTVLLLPFLRIIRGRMKDLLLAAVTLGVIHFGAVFTAMHYAEGVGAIAIASQLNVPFSTLLAILFLGESVGWRRVMGISLSFAGVVVLGFDPEVFTYWDALLVIVFAAFMYSVSAILMRRLKDVRAVTTQAWVGLAGMIGSLTLSAAFESGQIEAVRQVGSLAVWGIVYSAVGASIVGHGGANYLLRKYEVSVVSPFFLMMPVFAVFFGVTVVGEAFTWRMAAGGVLTLLGVAIVTLRNNARAKGDIAPVAIEEPRA